MRFPIVPNSDLNSRRRATRLAVAGLVRVGLPRRQDRRDRCLPRILHGHVVEAQFLAGRGRVGRIHHTEDRAKGLPARAIERREEGRAAGRRGRAQLCAIRKEAARIRGCYFQHLRSREHAACVAHLVHFQRPRSTGRRGHVGVAELSEFKVRRGLRPGVIQHHIPARHVVRVDRRAIGRGIEGHGHMVPDVADGVVRLIALGINIRRGTVSGR